MKTMPLPFWRKNIAVFPGKLLIVLFVGWLLCSGCFFLQGKADAEKAAEAFFEDRIENGGIGADAYYSDLFWRRNSRKQREQLQCMAIVALGNLKGYSLKTWKAHAEAGFRQSDGSFVTLIYDTRYERGAGQEALILFRGGGGEPFRILGHQIQSPQLQKLIDSGIDLTPQEV